MKNLIRLALVSLLLVGLTAGVAVSTVTRIPPATIGVRQDKWGGGIEPADFGAGFHLGAKGKHQWHFLDAGTHVLNFSPRADGPFSLEIRTKDNNTASIAATVTYRIREGQGHRLVQEGLERDYTSRVKSSVESALRKNLADLASEEWFAIAARQAKLAEIEAELDAAFANDPYRVERVVIRDVVFSKEYENELQEKQIHYQNEKLIDARTALTLAEGEAEELLKESEALVKAEMAIASMERQQLHATKETEIARIKARTELYDVQVRSEADRAHEEAVATGNLAVERAKALGNQLRLEALDSPGGRLWLAQQAASNLEIENVTLNSNDPSVPSILDLDELVRLLVGQTNSARND